MSRHTRLAFCHGRWRVPRLDHAKRRGPLPAAARFSPRVVTTKRPSKSLSCKAKVNAVKATSLLGEFVLTGLRKAPKGQVEISVTFEINADGIVSVQAKDLETGQEQAIQVTASSGLTPQELTQMISDAKEEMLRTSIEQKKKRSAKRCSGWLPKSNAYSRRSKQIVASSDFGRDATAKAKAVLQKARVALQAPGYPRAQRALRSTRSDSAHVSRSRAKV